MPAPLDLIMALAEVRTVGGLVDEVLRLLEEATQADLVSFNRLDVNEKTATVALRPYREEHEQAVQGVAGLLDQHPLFEWYQSQPDWSPRRISDITPWSEFRTSRLLTEVLEPIGARHTLVVFVTPPASGLWIYFAATRADQDFTDGQLEFCTQLQPALVALYGQLTGAEGAGRNQGPVTLTPRELVVLRHLASGLAAATIARRMATSPATVRKHLQNLYAKLGTSDRLGAVLRSRDLGLLREDEVTLRFDWNLYMHTGDSDAQAD
jgi:DNA-binding CsgD family transcriptional regulator